MSLSRGEETRLPLSSSGTGDRRSHSRNERSSSAVVQPNFSLQRLTLGSAVSPLLPKPIAPFGKNERKRAFASATYYSECFLNGITPVQADTAALDAQSLHNKWWVETKYHDESSQAPAKKRRVLDKANDACELSLPQRAEDTYVVTSEDDSTVSSRIPSRGEAHYPGPVNIQEVAVMSQFSANEINSVKGAMVEDLKRSGGDTTTSAFCTYLDILQSFYCSRGWDARWNDKDSAPSNMDGTWLTMSKPTYSDSQGHNQAGEYRYTLGRLSFDMFRPTNLVCSIQGVYNCVSLPNDSEGKRPRSLPHRLQNEIAGSQGTRPRVRNYE